MDCSKRSPNPGSGFRSNTGDVLPCQSSVEEARHTGPGARGARAAGTHGARASRRARHWRQQGLSQLLDQLPCAVLGLDRQDRILWANRCAIELLGSLAHPGRSLLDWFPDRQEAATLELGARCFELQRLQTPRGLGSHCQLLLNEICERQRSLDLREQQLRMLAHDLLSPQNSILALSRLQESDNAAFEACGGLRRIGDLAQYTRSLSRDFIELTLPEDQARQRFTSLCMSTLLRELVAGVGPCAKLQSVRLAWQVLGGDLRISGLRGPLMRAMQNLLVNAIKASPAGSEVRLELSERPGRLLLRVVDQAGGLPGLAVGQRCHSFAALQRSARAGTGFGIGLDIVHRVMRLHQGELSAEVDAKGTCFELSFPGPSVCAQGSTA